MSKGGVYKLTLQDPAGNRETIAVTPNHPYLRAANDNGQGILQAVKMDPGGAWTAAGFLKPGAKLQSATGATLTVVSATLDKTPTRVYNFEIAGLHNYATGTLQAWVHNAVPNNGGGPSHGSAAHNKAIDKFIRRLKRFTRAKNIRKNQVQVDVCGVGLDANRPDVQFDFNGRHFNVEFDTRATNVATKRARIRKNDPGAGGGDYSVK